MNEPGQLSMEEIKERLDFLEARVSESEGDSALSSIYWDELRHLRQVYDRMIMDSQGKGMVMMQDIMDKSPETRENYVSGVPVASTEAPESAPHSSAESSGESPAVNLTINVNGGSAMEPKINESLMRSQGDVRIPLDMQVRLEKARNGVKGVNNSGQENLEGIDQDKVSEADKKTKKKPGDEEPEESKDSDDMAEIKRHEQGIEHEVKEIADRKAEKSFYRSETETLEKSLLARQARKNTVASAAGYWLHKRLQKSCAVDPLARVVRETLEKSAGAALVMGIPVSASAESKKSAYAQIVALNCEIQSLQEKLQECNEPDEQVECNKKLRSVYEKLALAVMQSEGLGLKTEDMIVNKPDTRFSPEMTRPVIGVASKSQKGDLAKSKHFTGKLADGAKYAVTVWDKTGEISESDGKAAIEKSIGADKIVVAADEDVKLVIEG